MKKIKLAFITPKMIIGGAESYIITKTNWLLENGFEVIVISSGGENVKNLPIETSHYVIDRIDDSPLLFSANIYADFISSLSNILITNNVDIIESHNTFPAFHVAMSYKQTGIPFLINILHELSYVRNPLLAILTKRLNKFGLYYTLTSEMNAHIENTIHTKLKPTILPIPVRSVLAKKVDECENYILSVCRLSKDKMYVKYLIESFYNLYIENDQLKSFKLKIVGDGESYFEIENLVKYFNKSAHEIIIELKGTVVGKDLESLYVNCYAFVGMGTSLLLAASCGKPSIIAGFSKESESLSWGYWGENELDKNVIGIGNSKERVGKSLKDDLNILINSTERANRAGVAAKIMFSKYYDVESIMHKWKKEYTRVIVNANNNNLKIKKTLGFNFLINSLRVIRNFYKAIF